MRLSDYLSNKVGVFFVLISIAALIMACPADRRPDDERGANDSEAASDENGGADEATADESSDDEAPIVESDESDESADVTQDPDDHFGRPNVSPKHLVPGEGDLFALIRTNKGGIIARLYEDEAPITVANFVGLATGQVNYRHHETQEIMKGNFYDGTIFHRVIPDFMIQGGDPTGTGRGGPGYRFEDERQSLRFDRAGLLAMANAGPNTNGSQFFITDNATPHLNGRHTIFGTVVEGMDVVKAIARVKKGAMDRPNDSVVIEKLEVVRAEEQPSL